MGQPIVSLHAADEDSHYKLFPFKEYVGSKKRFDVYKYFRITCLAGSKNNVGWLVCSYVLERVCDFSIGLKRFISKNGTSQVMRPTETYNKECQDAAVQVPPDVKEKICEGAALCATQNLPFYFRLNTPLFTKFCRTLFETGQHYPVNVM